MSVEIDVRLENAVNVKVPHGETQKLDLGPDSLVSSKLRTRLILGGDHADRRENLWTRSQSSGER